MRRRFLLGAAAGLPLLARPALAQRDTSRWLVEMPARETRGDNFAIILSGDGGWRDLDRQIGRFLRDGGVPVLGFDCLNWFWTRRSPEQVAAELDRIIPLYASKWQTPRVALIGYSFGADVLPFAWNRMSAENKARARLIALLAFAKDAAFEIKVGDFIGLSRPSALPTAPEIPGLPPELVQCTFGAEEEDETACKAFEGSAAQIIRTAGGHHFDDDYRALANRILARLFSPGVVSPG
ncbi:AcvB/VirJ family lysyl-phosphatidylglycerol hydrolase [Teichococcus vastitatis]|uniref:Virulence factor n=1 Tax=Teichococcus vastitatis TaxID=2307076 RepID=A0ABS9WCC3_9PROT|nr:AcvB/VirJ family lysyl-phosphatidylglycerol hydrolase [Pseudoroseomonas vastitatis]MCI0756405.1 virulence factor [Pseudoroseomonas vastitatis]